MASDHSAPIEVDGGTVMIGFRGDSLSNSGLAAWLIALTATLLTWAGPAGAVPSYARQTGQPCAGCHVGSFGPQLNTFGREFKLRGYTISASDSAKLPVSAMMVVSYSHTAEDQSGNAGPYDGPNDNVSIQQLSLFVAGRLTEHIGVFSQVTYSDIDKHVAMDNYDIRYAKAFTSGKHAGVFGLSINNNPGLSDLRHSQAAWRFPFIGSELAPVPAAAVLSDGGLAQQVIGADAYVSVDSTLYASFGLYRTMSAAFLARINADYGGRIAGVAPYWRLSWQPGWGGGLALGLSGLHARIAPESSSTLSNRYDDFGMDAEYEKNVGADGGDLLTINANFTHERQRLDAAFASEEADRIGHSLNSANISASYHVDTTYGLTVGWFDVSGTRDSLLYAPAPDSGSLGSPGTRGEILQADWTPFGKAGSYRQPWLNLRLGIQYTHYDKFNGARSNFDGFGRAASDNDTLFVFLWTAI